MHDFWIFIASNVLVALGMAVLVALIARVWRNPAVLHLLWVLVLVKLFVPPLVDIPIAGLAGEPSAVEATPVLPISPMPVPSDEVATEIVPIEIVQPVLEPADPVAQASPGISWELVLIAVWLAGSAVVLAIGIWRIWVFARLLRRHATAPQEPIIAMAERLSRQIGLRRCPGILVLKAKIPPLVWLVSGRARIVLPLGLLENLSLTAQEAVLLHELAHVKRKDYLVRWLEVAATTVFWWCPIVWWARRELRAVEEQCCDAMVVRAMPRVAKDYAAALVDTLDFLSAPSPVVLPAGTTPWRATRLARRITMLKRSCVSRISFRGLVLVAVMVAVPMAISFAAGPAKRAKPKPPSKAKAELMGYVAWFFANNFRDVTAAKPIEWGEPKTDADGNRSIRCKYEATIWGREVKIMNQVFTFAPDGTFVRFKNVKGFPKDKVKRKFDTSTKNGMIELVRHFFTENFRDITARNTIEWGEPVKHKNGNVSIRYKYEATIWGKEVKIKNQIFTFGPDGKFVDVKNVKDSPKKTGKRKDKQVNYDQLLDKYKQAIEKDPDNADAYYNLGAVYHRLASLHKRPADFEQAERYYNQCLDRDMDHVECHRGLAVMLVEQGRFDAAFRLLKGWAERRADLADPKIELARLYEEAGDLAKAKQCLIESLAIDPDNSRAKAALKHIQEPTKKPPKNTPGATGFASVS